MVKVFAKLTCGCCMAEMDFDSEHSAAQAFAKVGLGHVSITDDLGVTHSGVDTFYGYSLKEDGMNRGLGYLADLLGGKAQWPEAE